MEVENNKEAKVSGSKPSCPTRLQKKAPVALKLYKEEMVPYNPFISLEDGSSSSSSSSTQTAIPLLSPVVPPPPPVMEGQSCSHVQAALPSQMGLWCQCATQHWSHCRIPPRFSQVSRQNVRYSQSVPGFFCI